MMYSGSSLLPLRACMIAAGSSRSRGTLRATVGVQLPELHRRPHVDEVDLPALHSSASCWGLMVVTVMAISFRPRNRLVVSGF